MAINLYPQKNATAFKGIRPITPQTLKMEQNIDAIKDMYLKLGLRKTAREINVCHSTLKNFLKKHNLLVEKAENKKRTSLSDRLSINIEDMKELILNGAKMKDLKEHYGISIAGLRRFMNQRKEEINYLELKKEYRKNQILKSENPFELKEKFDISLGYAQLLRKTTHSDKRKLLDIRRDERLKKILPLLEQNKSMYEIAKETSISYFTIHNDIKNYMMNLTQNLGDKEQYSKKWFLKLREMLGLKPLAEARREKRLKLELTLIMQNKSVKHIAEKINCSVRQIKHDLYDYISQPENPIYKSITEQIDGADYDKIKNLMKQKSKPTLKKRERLKIIINMLKEHKTMEEIAEKAGCSLSTIKNDIRYCKGKQNQTNDVLKNLVDQVNKLKKRKSDHKREERLKIIIPMLKENKSIKEISKKANCSFNTIYKDIKYYTKNQNPTENTPLGKKVLKTLRLGKPKQYERLERLKKELHMILADKSIEEMAKELNCPTKKIIVDMKYLKKRKELLLNSSFFRELNIPEAKTDSEKSDYILKLIQDKFLNVRTIKKKNRLKTITQMLEQNKSVEYIANKENCRKETVKKYINLYLSENK